jgi:hypothetical protein
MPTLLRLIRGSKRNPKPADILDLNQDLTTGKVWLVEDGFNPGPGPQDILWSGRSIRFDGEQRRKSSRSNAKLKLTYHINAGSHPEMSQVQRDIATIQTNIEDFEENSQGKKIYLEFRLDDGLTSVPAPVFGQWSHYYHVLDIDTPGVDLNSIMLGSYDVQYVARLTCGPYTEGLEQQASDAAGPLVMRNDGLLCAPSTTNNFTNPSFGHATYDNGWTSSDADLTAVQETDADRTRSLESAVLLKNNDALAQTFTQTLTLTAVDYVLSCYAKRNDGAAVTSSDLQIWGQGVARTTTFVSASDGWYLCYAVFTAAASASTHGVQVKTAKAIYVDDFQVEFEMGELSYPTPFCAGWQLGCSWSGTAHASTSTRNDTTLDGPTTSPGDEFTLAFWMSPLFDSSAQVGAITEFFNCCGVALEFAVSPIRLNLFNDGTSVGFSSTQSWSYGDWLHVAVRNPSGDNVELYLNGVLELTGSGATANNFVSPTGIFRLYKNTNPGTLVAAPLVLDGWRIWREALTAAQILQLYNNESAIKTAGDGIGMPPFLWTKDGDGGLDAVDGEVSSTAKDNFAVLGGVPGDAPAKVRFEFDPPTSGDVRGYYLARRATKDVFTPEGTSFLDYSGTADSGSSSGDAYEASAAAGHHTLDAAVGSPDALRGRANILTRLKVTVVDANVWPYYKLGLSQIVKPSRPIVVPANSQFLLRDLANMRINWPQDAVPPTMEAGLYIEAVSSDSLLDDLVAWWSLDETAGPRYDKAGNHHLSEIDSVASAAGKIGNAADFSGSDHLATRSTGNLSMSGDFTIAFWINLDAKAADQWIVAKWVAADYSREFLAFYKQSDDRLKLIVSNNGVATAVASAATFGSPSTATWYFVIVDHDDGTDIGISVNDGTRDTTAHTTGIFTGITDLALGAGPDGASDLNGQVDMVGVWRRLLTSAEKTALYNSGNGLDYPFTTTTVDLDFVNILPSPMCKITGGLPAFVSGDTVVIKDRAAWVQDASDSDSQLQRLRFVGDPITALPDHYNYLSLLMGRDRQAYDVSKTVTNFKAKITPRWKNPGGAVA